MRKNITLVLFGLQLLFVSAVQALTINLNDTGGITNTPAESGFQKAITFWESLLVDDVTVNLNAGFISMPTSKLGNATVFLKTVEYSVVRDAMLADATSSFDLVATNNLTPGPAFNTFINRTSDSPNGSGSAVPYLDNDGGENNSNIAMTSANAYALGLFDNPSDFEGNITFNNTREWDFDNEDGINSNAFDFVGVAIHEIGHVLGFISGVGDVDGRSIDDNRAEDQFLPYMLDLFRYSHLSADSGAIDMSADNRDKYFSIDGGSTDLAFFSTGRKFGDGHQPSHWRDNLDLGIMDPTFAPGELGLVTPEDIMAFDVIGWDVITAVPEPSPFALLLIGLAVIAYIDRYKTHRASA